MPQEFGLDRKMSTQTLQALGGHSTNLLQTRGFSAEGARQISDGKLPTSQSDLARLNSLNSDKVNAGPGGGPHIHTGGANTDGIIAILIGLLRPAVPDGTSNTILFNKNSAFGDGSVRSLNFSKGTQMGDGSV